MERRIAFHPKLGRLPAVEDWLRFGEQLVPVMAAAAVAGEPPAPQATR